MPIEAMAKRGSKPIIWTQTRGIIGPHRKAPYSVVQAHPDNLEGTCTILWVSNQLNGANKGFSKIPALENAEFVRFGSHAPQYFHQFLNLLPLTIH